MHIKPTHFPFVQPFPNNKFPSLGYSVLHHVLNIFFPMRIEQNQMYHYLQQSSNVLASALHIQLPFPYTILQDHNLHKRFLPLQIPLNTVLLIQYFFLFQVLENTSYLYDTQLYHPVSCHTFLQILIMLVYIIDLLFLHQFLFQVPYGIILLIHMMNMEVLYF